MTKIDPRVGRVPLLDHADAPNAPHELRLPAETDGYVDLRERCKCGSNVGRVRMVTGQLVVKCAICDAYAFNAPRSMFGLPTRAIPAVRVTSRYAGRCKVCGAEHDIGDFVYWTPKTKGVACTKCNENGGEK